MTNFTEQLLADALVERLAGILPLEKIILFGSRASGTASADSDWDVLVVGQSELPYPRRQAAAIQVASPDLPPSTSWS